MPDVDIHDDAAAVLDEQIAAVAQLCLTPPAFAKELGIGISLALVSLVAAALAPEVAPSIGVSAGWLVFGPKLLAEAHASMSVPSTEKWSSLRSLRALASSTTILLRRTEAILKQLKAARLDHTFEREMRRLLSVDILILDDFGLDALDTVESRDVYEVLLTAPPVGL